MTVGVISKFLGTITELLIPWMLSYILDNIVPLKDTRRVLIWGVYMTICAILALVMNIYANPRGLLGGKGHHPRAAARPV